MSDGSINNNVTGAAGSTGTRLSARIGIDRLRDLFGLEHNVLIFTTAGIIQSLGSLLWSGYLPKVLSTLGARGAMIGAYGTAGSLMGIVFPLLGGMLSDRMGRVRALVLSSVLAIGGYLAYMVAPVWWLFLPGLVLTQASATFTFMGQLAMVGDAVRARRRAISIAVQTVVGVLPGVVGPPLGGVLIGWLGVVQGVRVSLGITVALTLVAVWMQWRFYRRMPMPAHTDRPGLLTIWRGMRSELKRQLMADCLVRFGAGMSTMFVGLYVMDVLKSPAIGFGFLQSLETVATAAVVLPFSMLADRGRGGRRPYIAVTYFLFGAFPLALALVPSAKWLAPVFILSGMKLLGEPARKALIVDLAQGENAGQTVGYYFTVQGAAAFPASFVAGWLWEWMPKAPFIIGGCITLLGFLCMLWKGPKQADVI